MDLEKIDLQNHCDKNNLTNYEWTVESCKPVINGIMKTIVIFQFQLSVNQFEILLGSSSNSEGGKLIKRFIGSRHEKSVDYTPKK